jgi:hypothetical protein
VIGLPLLGQMGRSAVVRIRLAVATAEMRCRIDRLAELARSRTAQESLDLIIWKPSVTR